MAIKSRDIYKGNRKKHRLGKTIAWVCVAAVVLAIALFFILHAFCIYDEAGNATIVSPFSSEYRQYRQQVKAQAVASPSPSPSETPTATDDPAASGDPAVTDDPNAAPEPDTTVTQPPVAAP